jgi:hypothetical protein
MSLPPEILESLRRNLRDRAGTDELVRCFIEHTLDAHRTGTPKDALNDAAFDVMRSGLESIYPQAVDTVYSHAESEIEKIFLNSTILMFLYADPLGLIVQPPFENARDFVKQYRNHCGGMLEVDRKAGTEPGSRGSGFLQLIQRLESAGEITQKQRGDWERDYMFTHGLGWYQAFYLSLQPRFPDLKLDGRSLRPELLVWRLDDDKFNVIVECDGYSYHSDNEAFTRDRRRDRLLKVKGFTVLRFSGSEIVRDPISVSLDFFDYLQRAKTGTSIGT